MTTKYIDPTGLDTNTGDTPADPYLTPQQGFDDLIAGDGFVFAADGDYNQTSVLTTGNGSATGTITLQSSGGDSDLCSLSGNQTLGNYYLFSNNEAGVNTVIQNMTIKDHTRNDGVSVVFWNDQDFTLNNVAFDNLHITSFELAPTGFIRNFSANPANLTINGLSVRNCSTNFAGGTGYEGMLFSTNTFGGVANISGIDVDGMTITGDNNYQLNGVCFHRGINVWTGTNSFKNMTINGQHWSYGIIKLESDVGSFLHTIEGALIIDNVNQTLTGGLGQAFGYIDVSAGDTLTIGADVTITNCESIAGSGVDNGLISNLHANSSLIFSNSASIKINNNTMLSAKGVISNVGKGLAGKVTKFRGVIANNNAVQRGVIHIASTGGNTDLFCSTLYDNTTQEAGGIYSSPPTATNTVNIYNMTIYNNTSSSFSKGMYLQSPTLATNTYVAQNCIIWNGGVNEIIGGGLGTNSLTVDSCNIQGGIGATSGVDTYTNNIETDPLFVNPANGNFELQQASPCVGTGVKWWGNNPRPAGANGEPLPDIGVDMGSNQSKWHPSHPGNPNFVPL